MTAPIMPVHGFVEPGDRSVSVSLFDFPLERVPIVVVPVDAVSWRAMVDRILSATRGRAVGDVPGNEHPAWRADIESDLRAALNLPDGWTP